MTRKCYRCGKPTAKHQKIVTCSRPDGKWVWWCGCSKEGTGASPRHQYDCGHCRFAWCCGPLCACFGCWPKAPPERRRQVAKMQANWRARTRH
jgi:hypothetical protein